MDKKYQIFISSTYKDLIPERNKVRDTILSMYQFPIGMEMFSAADEDQWEIIKETIDSSDYYVLIIGKRYGTVIEAERINENPNYMTVPAALRELEKIEMIRGHDQIYRLDHAVTKTQKTILGAFGMDAAYVKHRANRISEQLKIVDHIGRAHNVQ